MFSILGCSQPELRAQLYPKVFRIGQVAVSEAVNEIDPHEFKDVLDAVARLDIGRVGAQRLQPHQRMALHIERR